MNELLEKMRKLSAKRVDARTMAETDFADPRYIAPLNQYLFNFIYSGKFRGPGAGLSPGLHMLAGASKSGKTQIGLNLVHDYLDWYDGSSPERPEGICLFYDTEFGGGNSWDAMGIAQDRVLHLPTLDLESLKHDMVMKLKAIAPGTPVIILLDSLGMIPSIKELNDAEKESGKADMSRAKEIKSLLRMITPRLGFLNIPMVCINHTGMSIGGFFPTEGQTGGQATTLAPQTVIFFGKSKIRAEGEDSTSHGLAGHVFKLKQYKSRLLKEGTVFEMPWKFGEDRPHKYTGLWSLAFTLGVMLKPSKGWRGMNLKDPETGEIKLWKFREKDVRDTDEWFEKLMNQTDFETLAIKKYNLNFNIGSEESADEIEEEEE